LSLVFAVHHHFQWIDWHGRKIGVLQNIAFNQIQASLGNEETRVANPEFITGLSKDDAPNKRLERYITHHCAFYLKAGELADWKAWSRSLKADDRTAVILHIANLKFILQWTWRKRSWKTQRATEMG
jgi:hypothetical protein